MRQHQETLEIRTNGPGLVEFTEAAVRVVEEAGVLTGLTHVFCRHTSASLLIQENADPDVQTDLERYFERIVPESRGDYIHTCEGPDDMPAHIRSALSGVQLSIPLIASRLALGTWQGIYLFEHRAMAHRRSVASHLLGE